MTSWTEGVAGFPLLADAALAVDLGLVLAVDCSTSIDAADYQIQMGGIAAALRHPSLEKAIASGEHGKIVFSLVLWSTARSQVVALPWRILANAIDLEIAARTITAAPRQWIPGGTGLAAAVEFSTALLVAPPFAAGRLVIDVSGDGADNEGGSPAAARDRAVSHGITINGLPILDGDTTIADYYRDQVIGGAGAFLEPTRNIMSFRDTILKKLLREISQTVS